MPDTITLSSPIQTVTVGSGISPDQSLFEGLAGFTAGREFHPALKISSIIILKKTIMSINLCLT